jgi:protein XagA
VRRTALLFLVAVVLAAGAAEGGAWTLDRNKFAVFAGSTASTAVRRYDNGGTPTRPIVFNKLLLQTWMEYGLTDAVTLFAAPEYVLAQSNMSGPRVATVRSASVEGGMRILLLSHGGMLSLQTSAKSAGAFDMSVSSSGESGRQFETRLLYGRSFKFFRHDAFIDVEAAQRWIARPRPNEAAFEGTAGCWVTPKNQLLLQSFNFATTGAVRPPYEPYWLSKLQLSLVHKLSSRWALQSGYFISLAGRNIVKESGISAAIWYQS